MSQGHVSLTTLWGQHHLETLRNQSFWTFFLNDSYYLLNIIYTLCREDEWECFICICILLTLQSPRLFFITFPPFNALWYRKGKFNFAHLTGDFFFAIISNASLMTFFYYIYRCTTIITTQFYSISIPNPQHIPHPPNHLPSMSWEF